MVWTGFKREMGGDWKVGETGWGDGCLFGEKRRHVTVTECYTHQMLRSEAVQVK